MIADPKNFQWHILGFIVLLTATACERTKRDVELPLSGDDIPPRIVPPAPTARSLLKADAAALPAGARAQFPAYDGDPFFVSLPVRRVKSMKATEVREQVIAPVLKAMGFERGIKGVATRTENGVDQPIANFRGLAQAVAYEYANHPQLHRRETQEMLDVFLGKTKPNRDINKAIELGEGMNFAQFVAGIERLEIQYPFLQVDGNVPIEHTLLIASRWQEQGVTSVWGALFNRYNIANASQLSASGAVEAAAKALGRLEGIVKVLPCERGADPKSKTADQDRGKPDTQCEPMDGPYLVLLPYGTDANGTVMLRYAYRMTLRAVWSRKFNQAGIFLLWLDAQDAKILELAPLISTVGATGKVYDRDAGTGTTTGFFQVDPSSAGQYTLRLTGMFNQLQYESSALLNVSIPDNANGSSANLANFDQAPLNDPIQALCAAGTNKSFQQVAAYATVYRDYQIALSQGIFTPFPSQPINITVTGAQCGAFAAFPNLYFGTCGGFTDPACPNVQFGGMSTAQDNTIVGHEAGHTITWGLTAARPSNWCGMPPCTIPIGLGALHDLADFWADHFEQTNCTGGWFGKNIDGINADLNCAKSSEDGQLPRLHSVTVPFDPASPGDHFPEHRTLGNFTLGYADGQIGAAALWQVNLGMRSKCRPSGWPQFGVRYSRAVKNAGFLGFMPGPTPTDTDIYRLLYDLEQKMVDQWATSGSPNGPPAFAHNGPHTTNKVTAGFARAGMFAIPYQCLDGNSATTDPAFCPAGENGGDSVVDIDDNDAANDITVNGVAMYTHDFLKLGGVAPTFQVWTGPRYMLNGVSGASTANNPAPCNAKFSVEVSTNPAFPGGSTIVGPWSNVNTDPTNTAAPQCFGTWTLSGANWTTLQAGGAGTRIYYRARTRDAMDQNERFSTQPGAGLWTVAPPYAVITPDGNSDY